MNPILYTAAGGANRILLAQHVSANNLSHANTVGFKSILETSKAVEREGSGFNTSVSVVSNSTKVDFNRGELFRTGRALDVGIDGQGFLVVIAPDGKEVYTRAGNLKADADGMLTINGLSVQGFDNADVEIPPYREVNIGTNGIINITPLEGGPNTNIGQLKLVDPDTNDLTYNVNGYFVSKTNTVYEPSPTVRIISESLEQSNVSTMGEIVKLMQITRQFEMQSKVMKAAEKLAENGTKLLQA
jgi:flagellar basal-body rod protein FlgF